MKGAKKSGNECKSAFKTLLVQFLEANGDMQKVAAKYRSAIKCFVKESSPNFLITDGVFFISGHFTKEALEKFSKKHPTYKMEALKGFLIDILKWHLELALVDSTKSFTSYANLELRLVIQEFGLGSETKQELENKQLVNLFRDDDCRTRIQNFLYAQQQAALKSKAGIFEFGATGAQSIDAVETEAEFKGYSFLNRTETVVAKKDSKKKVGDEEIVQATKSAPVKKETSLNLKKRVVSTKVTKQIKKPVKQAKKAPAKSKKPIVAPKVAPKTAKFAEPVKITQVPLKTAAAAPAKTSPPSKKRDAKAAVKVQGKRAKL